MRVLSQGNPVYLGLELPGLETHVGICFPAQTITRVYAKSGKHSCFIGESKKEKHPIWTAPTKVSYHYGMSLTPWMFDGYLDRDTPTERDHIVNYIVLNCSVGHEGVNIRLFRTYDRQQKEREWLEIHQFDTGNEYHFAEEWKKQSRMIARFERENLRDSPVTWKPQGDWAKYRPEKIPCKI